LLLVSAHEADHLTSGCRLDDGLKPSAHHLLELHALFDDGAPAPALQQRLLHA
jgi:hypothetical protein